MRATARNYTGHQKNAVRYKTVTHGKVYKNILDLPGQHCRSIQTLLDDGNVNGNTAVTVVERYEKTMTTIRHKFASFPFRKVNFPTPGLIENTPDFGPYDYVNLDTCSSLSPAMLNWINRQKFLPGGELNVWLTAYRNRQSFKDSLRTTFLETAAGTRTLLDVRRNAVNELDGTEPDQLVTATAIFAALNRYDCTVRPVLKYCEHVNFMYVYRFTNIRERAIPRPGLEVMVESEDSCRMWDHGGNGPAKLADDPLMVMIVKAVQRGPGAKAYTTRMMRQYIENQKIAGKKTVMVKAGWKSYMSKRYEGGLRLELHNYIDGV